MKLFSPEKLEFDLRLVPHLKFVLALRLDVTESNNNMMITRGRGLITIILAFIHENWF